MLEARALLAVDVVTSPNDSGSGSLRETIALANAGDTIEFSPYLVGSIALTGGPIAITQYLNFQGPGANNLAIYGNMNSRVFQVGAGVTASISGLTIEGGVSGSGGGISNAGTLFLTGCTVSGNTSDIYAGGGISNQGTLSITNCTVSGNAAQFDGYGGGIYNAGGTVAITNSTISDNSAVDSQGLGTGGGIFNSYGTMTLTNCTISGNSSGGDGGGIYNIDGTMTIADSTIAGNSAGNPYAGGSGGGIESYGSELAPVSLANTIVADNTAPTNPDVDGAVTSLGYNLIGNSSGFEFFVPTDLLNVNPLFGPLQYNGGPTQTMGLLPGSPAIDAGNNLLLPAGVTTDQRGLPRDANGVDIGAFEVQVYQVYSTADSGGGTLRAALTNADHDQDSVIAITTGGVIDLESPLPTIDRDVQILGPGASVLTVSGNDATQLFNVYGGVTAVIAGMTIADGTASNGGGILNAGTLTVNNCTIADDSAQLDGGGIDNEGALTVADSTFAGDSAQSGGGIQSSGFEGVTLTVTNCTFSGNSAQTGGGIICAGLTTIDDSTLAGNPATTSGGGLSVLGGTTTLANTIIAGNTAPTGPDVQRVRHQPGSQLDRHSIRRRLPHFRSGRLQSRPWPAAE